MRSPQSLQDGVEKRALHDHLEFGFRNRLDRALRAEKRPAPASGRNCPVPAHSQMQES